MSTDNHPLRSQESPKSEKYLPTKIPKYGKYIMSSYALFFLAIFLGVIILDAIFLFWVPFS